MNNHSVYAYSLSASRSILAGDQTYRGVWTRPRGIMEDMLPTENPLLLLQIGIARPVLYTYELHRKILFRRRLVWGDRYRYSDLFGVC